MLATFVIGLREGLEAALIVGIIAAFLKRHGKSLTPMWAGVAAALVLSLAVGVTLKVVESNLPQRAQEGLETVIGAVAVVFVTSMIVWMRTNARGLKAELEQAADSALHDGTTRALAGMAFLAVLKEGFETSVFLLATFQGAADVTAAVSGAVLGLVVSAALGYGIYRGGVRLDLAKFFTYTGFFLVLVAAGLVSNALRTAYEAGWLTVGQQETVDLTALAPGGSIRGALLTGVLGIPAKPVLVQVLGWLAYLVPMMLYLYLPPRFRPDVHRARRLQRLGAGVCGIVAVALALLVPSDAMAISRQAPLQTGGQVILEKDTLVTPSGRAHLDVGTSEQHAGVTATRREAETRTVSPVQTMDVATVVELNGGRVPVGINLTRAPGPYQAVTTTLTRTTAWTVKDSLLDASAKAHQVLTLSGGGLVTPRTLGLTGQPPASGAVGSSQSWNVHPSYVAQQARHISAQPARDADHRFWGSFVPGVLVITAIVLMACSFRSRTRSHSSTSPAAVRTSAATP